VDIHALLQAMPRQRAIHRARVHVNVAERLRHELGVRALAARARAVNGYDNRLFQIHFCSCVSAECSKIILYGGALPRRRYD